MALEKLRSFTKRGKADKQELNGDEITQCIGTPFMVRVRKNDVIITLGDNIVGTYKSKREAYDAIHNRDWNLILTASIAIQETVKKAKNYEGDK